MPESQARLYAAMITSALGYLHARYVAHRDIKPENLLFDAMGYLKLIDFGCAKKIKERSFTLCGTPEYLAPEIIASKGHGVEADWWSVGVLLYEMVTGRTPFAAESQVEVYRNVMAGRYKQLGGDSKKGGASAATANKRKGPATAGSLVTKLLVVNPSRRCGCGFDGAREVKASEYFTPIDWHALVARTLPMPYTPELSSALDTSHFDDDLEEDDETWNEPIPSEVEERFAKAFAAVDVDDKVTRLSVFEPALSDGEGWSDEDE